MYNLSIGISAFWASTIVHLPLHRPIECPWVSTGMCCCPPVLLSVLLSTSTEKIPTTGRFVAIEIHEKTRSEEVILLVSLRVRFSQQGIRVSVRKKRCI